MVNTSRISLLIYATVLMYTMYEEMKGVSIMDNYEKVLSYFKTQTEPVNAGKVAEATGVDRKEVDKIMKKMKDDATIVSPKRCYWSINA